jgi:hypothetical protein
MSNTMLTRDGSSWNILTKWSLEIIMYHSYQYNQLLKNLCLHFGPSPPSLMNSIQGEILTSEVCVSVKRSGDLANGRRDV